MTKERSYLVRVNQICPREKQVKPGFTDYQPQGQPKEFEFLLRGIKSTDNFSKKLKKTSKICFKNWEK